MAEGWDAVSAAVTAARAQVVAASPDPATAAEGEAYVLRVLTVCLNDAFLGHLLTDGGLSRALPTRGGPNPDYRMVHAGIDPARRYRLEGRLNASERVGVGLYSFGPGGSADISEYAAFDAGNAGPDGSFAIDIAANVEGPATLKIRPGARVLLIRTLHRDPLGEPAYLRLSGGAPLGDLTLAGGSTDAALTQAARALANSIRQFLEWTAVTSAAPNCFLAEEPQLSQGVQGDPDTIYYLGYYDLGDGEWLEAVMPAGIPGYWSLHAYDHWCEALPGAGIHDRSGVADPDGRFRIAIGPSPDGDAPNRIDTLGRRRGILICRIIGAEEVAVPQTRLHRHADL